MVVEPDVYLDVDNKGRTGMRDPKTGRWNRQLNAILVDSVPLDNRTSLYLRFGDWFAGTLRPGGPVGVARQSRPQRRLVPPTAAFSTV